MPSLNNNADIKQNLLLGLKFCKKLGLFRRHQTNILGQVCFKTIVPSCFGEIEVSKLKNCAMFGAHNKNTNILVVHASGQHISYDGYSL
jgi:hypothetical protein